MWKSKRLAGSNGIADFQLPIADWLSGFGGWRFR
jgi:hypothetical protein